MAAVIGVPHAGHSPIERMPASLGRQAGREVPAAAETQEAGIGRTATPGYVAVAVRPQHREPPSVLGRVPGRGVRLEVLGVVAPIGHHERETIGQPNAGVREVAKRAERVEGDDEPPVAAPADPVIVRVDA